MLHCGLNNQCGGHGCVLTLKGTLGSRDDIAITNATEEGDDDGTEEAVVVEVDGGGLEI